jgi:hypothetical protein
MIVSWPVLLLLCGILIAVALILFLPTSRSRAKARIPTDRQQNGPIYRDDDRYWYGGFFYNNPDDPDPLVPKRYGFGWAVNFGHPVGKAILVAIVVLGLVLPLVVAILGVLSLDSFTRMDVTPLDATGDLKHRLANARKNQLQSMHTPMARVTGRESAPAAHGGMIAEKPPALPPAGTISRSSGFPM